MKGVLEPASASAKINKANQKIATVADRPSPC
jgi:hypothetical protein